MSKQFQISTFNLYNLLRAPDDPLAPTLPVKLAKLVVAISDEMALPDILAVQEVGDEALLVELANKINQRSGTRYRALAPPCSDERGIRVGLMWDEARVKVYKAGPLAGQAIEATFGRDSISPGREPLVGYFGVAGRTLIVAANHFKSDHIGDVPPASVARAQAACLRQRLAQARAVRAFVDDLLANDPGAWLAVAGDLNQAEGRAPGNPVAILAGVGTQSRLVPVLPQANYPEAYTFRRDGKPIRLDHILLSPALADHLLTGQVHHFNVDYRDHWRYDETSAYRVSDHDPLSAYFMVA